MAIQERFNTDIDLRKKVKRILQNRISRLWLYKLLLEKVNPNLVVIVKSSGKHTLIEACQAKSIPVVELQHGVIYPAHPVYSFRGTRNNTLFPDYLLTWGEFWRDNVDFSIPDNRVIPVGYPHLEQSASQYETTQSQKQIVFISQGTIGEQLSKFAMEVDRHPDIDHNIVYKLHPGEYDRWREEYPWLIDADFEIIDHPEVPLYELFAESSVQIGVSSTAIYEGLKFDLETYVYDCSESKILKPLIQEGSARIISSADELVLSLESEGSSFGTFDSHYYFAPNATERICQTFHRLADEGTPSNIN